MRTLSGLVTALSAKARKYPPEALRRAARLGRATARRALALTGLREPVWEIRFVARDAGPGRPRLAVALDLDAAGPFADDVRAAFARITAEVDERLEWSSGSGRYRLESVAAGATHEGTLPAGQSPATLLSSELVFVARGDAAAMPPAHLETIAATAEAEGLGVVAVAAPQGDPLSSQSVLMRREIWGAVRPPSGPILAKVVPVLGPPSPSATRSLAESFRRLGVASARGVDRYAVDAPAGGGAIPHAIAPIGATLGAAARPDGRATVLLLLPYVAVGGVEKLTLDMMRSLGEGYRWVVVSLVPLAITIYRFFVWKLEEYVVTNYRILQVEGIINKQTLDSALEKVNDVLMTQSLAGRMFGYGNIDILTGSERGINSLTGIADPFAFKRALLNAKMQLDDPGEGWRRSSTADHARLLSALADLRDSGVISGDEYEQRREQLSRG